MTQTQAYENPHAHIHHIHRCTTTHIHPPPPPYTHTHGATTECFITINAMFSTHKYVVGIIYYVIRMITYSNKQSFMVACHEINIFLGNK